MTSATSSTPLDTTPFLERYSSDRLPSRFFERLPNLRNTARFLWRSNSNTQRPSARVREVAAEHLEGRRSNWAYSKPIVVLDLAWNMVFVIVAVTAVAMSMDESPSVPLRVWIIGYGLQCALHMVFVLMEYQRRRDLRNFTVGDWSGERLNSSSSSESEREDYGMGQTRVNVLTSSISKHMESANTMLSFIWWIMGFYWISAGGQSLNHDAPQLYWLSIMFMAFDVLFVVICVAVASLLGFAVCCFLPCIIAILYVVADLEGATKEQIDRLPKYTYHRIANFENFGDEIPEALRGMMTECGTDTRLEHVLSLEDAECCICLCEYDDGSELRQLPCRHHFHCVCIDKWLHINATCPLCKSHILDDPVRTYV